MDCVISGIESNAENFENDEAEESQEDQNKKVINNDKEHCRAMIPFILRFGNRVVQFFDLGHCRAESGGFRSSPHLGYC